MAAGKDLPMARILVIDDDPLPTRWITSFLASAGHEVDTARNSYQALQLQSTVMFDLILVDSIMPDREGLNLIWEFRNRRLEIPIVIMVSTLGTDIDREVAALTSRNVAQGVCRKDYVQDDLPRILEKLLN